MEQLLTKEDIMYCENKGGLFWVWSSRLASLDCMPQYKFKTLDQAMDLVVKPIVCTETANKDKSLYFWAKNLN
jgi:hypothetical protein